MALSLPVVVRVKAYRERLEGRLIENYKQNYIGISSGPRKANRGWLRLYWFFVGLSLLITILGIITWIWPIRR
jgi:hypothetical protein